MNPWTLNNGLTVASAVLIAGGCSALLFPNGQGFAVVAGTAGGAAAVISTQKQQAYWQHRQQADLSFKIREELQPLEQHLQSVDREFLTLKEALSPHSNTLISIEQKLVQLHTQMDNFVTQSKSETAIVAPSAFNSTKPRTSKKAIAVNSITEWLQAKQFHVIHVHQHNDQDQKLDKVADFLGNHYEQLEFLHSHLKDAVQRPGEQIEFKVKGLPEYNRMITFCNLLFQKELLSHYQYRSGSGTIEISAHHDHTINNFIKGQWFERYTRKKIIQWLHREKLKHRELMNLSLQLTPDKKCELDLLFMVEGQPLWVECKGGQDYKEHFEKYSDYSQILDIPKARSLIVVLGCGEQQMSNLSEKWNLTVVNENTLIPTLSQVPFRTA